MYTRDDRSFPERYVGPDTDARIAALKTVAQEVDATINQIVLAWMAQRDPPVIPLIAASTVQLMEENLGASGVQLSAEQMDRLSDAGAQPNADEPGRIGDF